ncbi:ABC transporter ATP-binding protein [Halobacillus sp. HZG1]|uniref:ABC transporter ATP-binding protein n=1 Tax=Halobacillus sp. HZG1 TaxID=3111769 RepID=UPI002DBB69BE|nr:ABC transporter ATP-binding protein [Halobacillus sp. HZG1]MEC3885149.1 ABC transporter ATP-binding protein [Halobacillus sp. HZG1]
MYGENHVVKDFDLTINQGEVFGLLGPNGAGKTTTISMMTSQNIPNRGKIFINGMNVRENRKKVKSIVGIVPQDIALYPMLNAVDNLKFFGELYGIKRKKLNTKVLELLDLVGLKERAKDPIKNYSGGMKRRINIAAALLHDPKVVFMDEPTVGIDPQSRNQIFSLIKLLKEQGITVVYTTHYMEEATTLCDRVAIVDNGDVISLGTTKELVDQVYGGVIEFTFNEKEDPYQYKNSLSEMPCVHDMRYAKGKVEVVVEDANDDITEILEFFKQKNSKVKVTNIMQPSLETLFLFKTGKKLRD